MRVNLSGIGWYREALSTSASRIGDRRPVPSRSSGPLSVFLNLLGYSGSADILERIGAYSRLIRTEGMSLMTRKVECFFLPLFQLKLQPDCNRDLLLPMRKRRPQEAASIIIFQRGRRSHGIVI